jgi:hypothetical protein
MKQSHALAELPKRRFIFGAASYLNGIESWANSPRKVEQRSLDSRFCAIQGTLENTGPAES